MHRINLYAETDLESIQMGCTEEKNKIFKSTKQFHESLWPVKPNQTVTKLYYKLHDIEVPDRIIKG